jgi:tRNA-dihydrouridine synthase
LQTTNQNSIQTSVKNKSTNKLEIRQKIEKIVQINKDFDSNYQNKTIDKTIIIGNGDVLSLQSAFDKVCEFGVDGVMIGRGIFGNPWLFGGIDASLKSPKERVNLLIFHLNLWQKTWQSGKNYQSLKKYFKIYIQGFAGAVELRVKLMETDKSEKAIEIATNYLNIAD